MSNVSGDGGAATTSKDKHNKSIDGKTNIQKLQETIKRAKNSLDHEATNIRDSIETFE